MLFLLVDKVYKLIASSYSSQSIAAVVLYHVFYHNQKFQGFPLAVQPKVIVRHDL